MSKVNGYHSKRPHKADGSDWERKGIISVVKSKVEGEALHLRWLDGQSALPLFGKIASDGEEGGRIFSVSW